MPLGALLEVGCRLYVRTIAPMLAGMLLVVVPGYVLFYFLVRLVEERLNGYDPLTASAWVHATQVLIVFLVAVEGGVLVPLMASAVCLKLASDRMFGPTRFGEAMRYAAARLPSMLVALGCIFLVMIGIGLVASLLGYFPVILVWPVVIALVLFVMWLFLGLSFTIPSVLFAGAKGPGALSRSLKVIRGAWWRCLGTFIVVGVPLLALVGLVQRSIGVTFGSILGVRVGSASGVTISGASATAGDVARFVLPIAVGALVEVPIFSIVLYLLYLDLSVLTDRDFDAEDIGRSMGSLPGPEGLVFTLAEAAPARALGPPGGGRNVGLVAPGGPGGAARAAPEEMVPLPAFYGPGSVAAPGPVAPAPGSPAGPQAPYAPPPAPPVEPPVWPQQ